MHFETITPVDISADRVDLPDWFFSMSDDQYRAASPAHLAFGSFRARDGRRGAVAVEQIGGALMIHHYEEAPSTPGRLRISSPHTQAWVGRLLPFSFSADVTMELRALREGKSEFVLTIEMATRHRFVQPVMRSSSMRKTTERHMREESAVFVRDIVERYGGPETTEPPGQDVSAGT